MQVAKLVLASLLKIGMALQELNEIVSAQTHIWNHIFNFINSSSLKCAVQLGIPDVIHKHGGPITLEELVDALAINKAKAHHLARLMRVLTRSGFFLDAKIKDEDGYALGPPSCLLIKDHPFSLAPFVLGASSTIFTGPWHRVSEWFHNDDPTPYQTAHGRTFWDCASQDPEMNHYFNQAMAFDVGGGTGMVARAIADDFPDTKCSVLDLPHVVAGLEGTKNLAYVAGDMFKAIPPAQAILLKRVMHDWNDEDCVKILKKCKEAISDREKGGKVIIVDMIVGSTQNGDDDELIQSQIFLDVQMMVYYGGKERTLKEWVKIFNDTVELGIADTIHSHGRPITLQQLAHALRINNAKADHLARLMRLLTRAGFFLDAKDGAAQDPELSRYFNQAMAFDTLLLMSLIKKHCRGVFEGLDSLVDVGGGTGMAARAIADEFPDMKCTVLDLPHVVAGLEGTKNLTYVVGNMFEAIPPAHAVFLKVTH
nr:trans-resveratrol di-O-methyltransferase-like [Ipomoea batatas]